MEGWRVMSGKRSTQLGVASSESQQGQLLTEGSNRINWPA